MLRRRILPLHPRKKFLSHLLRNAFLGVVFIAIALGIGMIGYHSFEKMSWVEAFLNASMILSGMGPVRDLLTTDGKIFAGIYALFSGLAFIAIMTVMFSPIIYRFFHKIHLDIHESSNE